MQLIKESKIAKKALVQFHVLKMRVMSVLLSKKQYIQVLKEKRVLLISLFILFHLSLFIGYRCFLSYSSITTFPKERINFVALEVPETHYIKLMNHVAYLTSKNDVKQNHQLSPHQHAENTHIVPNGEILAPTSSSILYNKQKIIFTDSSFKNAKLMKEKSFNGQEVLSLSFQLKDHLNFQFPKSYVQKKYNKIILFLDDIPISSMNMHKSIWPIKNFKITGIKNSIFAQKIINIIKRNNINQSQKHKTYALKSNPSKH